MTGRAMKPAASKDPKQQQRDARRASQIISRLAHDGDVSDEAVAELVELGEAALDALSANISVDHLPTQRMAALALSRLGTRRALAPILNTVTKVRQHPELVATLLNAAAELLEPKDKERVRPFLLHCLQHESATVRLAAVECIRATDDEEALAAVMALQRDPSPDVQAQATQFLSASGNEADVTVRKAASMTLISALGANNEHKRRTARNELLRHPDRERVVVEHLYDQNPFVRRSVLEVAAALQLPNWHQAMIEIAGDEKRSTQERALALRGVLRLSDGENGEDHALVERLLAHSDLFLRAEAARLGATTDRGAAAEGARALVPTDEPWVRKRFADGWAGSTGAERPHHLPQLVNALSRESDWLQKPTLLDIEAFQSLCGGLIRQVEFGSFIDGSLLDALSMLRIDTDPAIAEITRRTLETLTRSTGLMSASERVELDLQALYDDDPELRLRAIASLSQEKDVFLVASLPILIRFLYSATPDELVALSKTLWRLRDHRAVDALARLASHPDPRVRAAATQHGVAR